MFDSVLINSEIYQDSVFKSLDGDSRLAIIAIATNPNNHDVDHEHGHLVIDKQALSFMLSWPYEKTARTISKLIEKRVLTVTMGNAAYEYFLADFTNPDWVLFTEDGSNGHGKV